MERHAPNSNPRLAPPTQSRLSNGQRELAQAHAGPRGDAAVLDKVVEPERGNWRLVFTTSSVGPFNESKVRAGSGWIGPGEWCLPEVFDSEDVALRAGKRIEQMCNESRKFCGWKYLRTEFFPEYG